MNATASNIFRVDPKANTNTNTQTQGEPKPKSKCWLNIGYWAEVNGTKRFVNLAQGIALDDLKYASTNSSNAEFAQFRAAQNGLLDKLRKFVMTQMEPGQESYPDQLVCQLRHAKDDQEIPVEGNPFAAGFSL